MSLTAAKSPATQDSPSTILEAYKRDGFYLCRGLLDPQKIANARRWLLDQDLKSLAKSWTEQEPAVELAVYSVIHKDKTPLSELANDEAMLKIAAQCMESPVYIWSSKINLKAAWCGTAEYYHQDFVYWKDRGYQDDRMMSCMVFMEPHNFNNAGLCVFPGSHKNGFVEHMPFINVNGLSKFMVPPKTLDKLNAEHGWLQLDAKPGDVLFFHTGLVHGSAHNISPNSRMILLSQLNAIDNKPHEVKDNARAFNLSRAKNELEEAKRRCEWFQKKYDEQLASEDLTFCPPIPDPEKT